MKFFASAILIVVLFTIPSKAQQYDEDQLQVMFMYQFTKYVIWPSNGDKFKVGVYNDPKMVEEVSKRFTGGRFEVIHFTDISQVANCNILYTGKASESEVTEIKARLANQPILLVSFRSGMARKASHINFTIRDGRMKFELNETQMAQNKLRVSADLKKLAILI